MLAGITMKELGWSCISHSTSLAHPEMQFWLLREAQGSLSCSLAVLRGVSVLCKAAQGSSDCSWLFQSSSVLNGCMV